MSIKRKYKTILILLCLAFWLSGCGQSLYENHKSSYTAVNVLTGVSADIPTSFLNATTVITSLSEDMSLETTIPYLYKDGDSTYKLFQLNGVVIIASKGTNFSFSTATSKSNALTTTGMDGTWFSPEGKKFQYTNKTDNGVYKIILTVSAETSITNTLYGNYVGKLAVIETSEEEWSLFVGAVCDSYEDLENSQKKIIEHIVASFSLSDTTQDEEEAEEEIEESVNSSALKEIGAWGRAYYYEAEWKQCKVILDNIYVDEAEEIIASAFEEGRVYLEDITPPEGCYWVVAEYRVSTDPKTNYIDVSLMGTDFSKLRYKGYYYSMRSYEICYEENLETPDEYGLYTLYRFFAVPNGCMEFSVCLGDTEKGEKNVFYYVNLEE